MSKNQPKPPLCKGRWQKSMIFDGGVVNETLNISEMQLKIWNISYNNPSVSFADSSLYTREPFFVTSFFDSLQKLL